MAEQEWLRPEIPAEASGTSSAAGREARFELRPLSLGEILDRTFALYRSRFWLFAGIAMIAATFNVISQAISLATAHKLAGRMAAPNPTPAAALANLASIGTVQAKAYVVVLLFFLVSAITHAATAWAMTQVYLHKPATVETSVKQVLPVWHRWIGIALWQLGSMLWIPVAALLPGFALIGFGTRTHNVALSGIGVVLVFCGLLGGFPAGVVLYLRNALAIPAAVNEGLTIRPAMRRSKALAAGTKGRIFVVLLIAFCLLEVVGILQSPVAVLMVMAPNQEHILARAIALLITFVGHTVVAPVALIGLTLVYFDQRVRREALDLELLLQDAQPSVTAPFARDGAEGAGQEGYAPFG